MGRAVDIGVQSVDSSIVEDGQTEGSGTEAGFAAVLAEVTGAERVAAETHFFDDLGADSLVMARFCARVRKRADLPPVSMKDIYAHPTVASLATALDGAASAEAGETAPATLPAPVVVHPVRTRQYVLCGALQLLFLLAYPFAAALIAFAGYHWIAAAGNVGAVYLRAVAFSAACVPVLAALPIAAKWLLIGRWKPAEIPVWSLAYFRFWVVRTLIRTNPLVLFVLGRSGTSSSSPLYVLYLRALGAKIGKDVTIFSRNVPVCADLLTIGDRTVIRKDAFFPGYRADSGVIRTGTVTLGADVFVGETAVLDIDTSMGDGTQLGHSSALHAGQSVPDGETWHGCPGQRTRTGYLRISPIDGGRRHRVVHGIVQLLAIVTVYLPLVLSGTAIVFGAFPRIAGLVDASDLLHWSFYTTAMGVSAVVFAGVLLVGLLVAGTVPRLLSLAVKPGRVYPLYGFHYWVHRTISRLTNFRFFTTVFGDSSYIVGFLRWLGYDLSHVEQTGSNFGNMLKHETPFHVSVGRGTMVADGLSVINTEYSNSSFSLARVTIGPHNFLGNNIAYPAGGRTGDNCLLGTKVMVPLDGEARKDAGLLGAPSFRIPRSVERDSRFDHLRTGDALKLSLKAKNRYNLRTIAVFLLMRWGYVFGVVLVAMAAAGLAKTSALATIAGETAFMMLFTVAYFVLAERMVAWFRKLRPRFCSIYQPYFWWHERYWKFAGADVGLLFAGTPLKNVISRALGLRIGRQVFDDGCSIIEKTLTSLGDRVMLNTASVIQCHSQEDGTFKSDHSEIGADGVLSVGAFVHYGVSVGEGAMIGAGSFLMKGEEVPPHEHWNGNPARKT